MGYDVIVVGARVAGAATAMLLARQGVRVLMVDRASFPSDTISSHQVQVPGAARLHRWGLLDRLRAAGTLPTRRVRFDSGDQVLEGCFPAQDGVDALYSPRRTMLDALLVDAARAAGAGVRERFRAEELIWSEGRVTGIRGSERGGGPAAETARLVVGADGKHSFVAGAVRAARYRQRPVRSFACYTYWSGVPVNGGELYQRPGCAVAAFPTNDDLVMVYLAAPLAQFGAFRGDIEGHYLRALDLCGDLGDRVRSGTRAERLRTTPDQPNTFRRSPSRTRSGTPNCSPAPSPPGWAATGTFTLRSPRTSASETRRSGRCTTSPSGSPGSPPGRRTGCCSPPWLAGLPKSPGSSALSPASCRPIPTSRPRPCCAASVPGVCCGCQPPVPAACSGSGRRLPWSGGRARIRLRQCRNRGRADRGNR